MELKLMKCQWNGIVTVASQRISNKLYEALGGDCNTNKMAWYDYATRWASTLGLTTGDEAYYEHPFFVVAGY